MAVSEGCASEQAHRAARIWLLYSRYVIKEEWMGFSALPIMESKAVEGMLLMQPWQRGKDQAKTRQV